jgi:hypothetical protein
MVGTAETRILEQRTTGAITHYIKKISINKRWKSIGKSKIRMSD